MGQKACPDMECVVDVLVRLNMTFGALMSIPEQDDWLYPDGKNMVCDVSIYIKILCMMCACV